MKHHNPKPILLIVLSLPLITGLLLLTGCKPDPVAWDLEIAVKTKYSGYLDLIGIHPLDKQDWEGVTPDTKYWEKDNALREKADRVSLEINLGKISLSELKGAASDIPLAGQDTDTILLPRKHPIWKKWLKSGAAGLLVMSGPNPTDKVVLPLYKQYWQTQRKFLSKERTLQIEIRDGKIVRLTPYSPEAADIKF